MNQFVYDGPFDSSNRITMAVQRIILLTSLVFVMQLLFDVICGDPVYKPQVMNSPVGRWVLDWFAFEPGSLKSGCVFNLGTLSLWAPLFWTPVTYIFLHGGLMHLFFNLWCLYLFGPTVEKALTTRRFYWFYIWCGAAGVFAAFIPYFLYHMGVLESGTKPIVGASGAILGCMAAFALIEPDRKFYILLLPIPITARNLIIILVAINAVFLVLSVDVAVSAHLGGLFAGYAYMRWAPYTRQRARRMTKKPRDAVDAMGEVVDNILNLDEEKRKRR